MPFVSGFLRLRRRPVDPGYDGGISAGHPDNELPDHDGPVDPGFGNRPPIDPDFDIPLPPPGVWPPPNGTLPIVPAPPGTPPGVIWPRPPGIDNALPAPPPGGGGTLPVPRVFWMLCYCQALGWNFVTVDPSLRPDNTLPATPEPKA